MEVERVVHPLEDHIPSRLGVDQLSVSGLDERKAQHTSDSETSKVKEGSALGEA
jgi:hypothetical protein